MSSGSLDGYGASPMRSVLLVVLVLASFPVASANHDACAASACAYSSSAAVGDCETASGSEYAYNTLGAYSNDPGPVGVGGSASTQCSDYSFPTYGGESSTLFAGASLTTPVGTLGVGMLWSGGTSTGGGTVCTHRVYTYGVLARSQDLGCAAGRPPEVPVALIP